MAKSLSKRTVWLALSGLASACALGIALPSFAQTSAPNWALGQPNAPVTLLEYGSLTCSHCAEFHRDVLPTIKRLYIDTGKVKLVYRPMPTPPYDLAVALHVLTLCAGPNRYYPLVSAFYERQQEIFAAAGGETGPKGTIFAIAEDVGGLNYAAAEACLRDLNRQTQVRVSAEAGVAAGVEGTPTLFVNGVVIKIPAGQHHLEVANVSQAIDAALARPRAPARSPARPPVKAKKR